MKAWKTKHFQKWQKKEAVSDNALSVALVEICRGLIDADLGGGVIKKRVAREGSGKRSGYRVLLATNKQDRWFFVYGFSKKDQENISSRELATLHELADYLLNLSHSEMNESVRSGVIKEVDIYAKQNT